MESTNIQTIQLDLRDWKKTEDVLKGVGPVDLLVNNAAIAISKPILDITEEDIDQ